MRIKDSRAFVDRIIRDAARNAAREQAAPLPKAHTVREPSVAEQLREYIPYGYHALFCFHDKSYYEPCAKCRRDAQDAQRNLQNFLKSHGLV